MKYKRLSKFPCPVCGTLSPVYDSTQRTWRHLNFFQYETYIHAKVPRVKCPKDGIKRIEVPWARKETGFTLLFEAFVLQMVKYMAVSQIAKLFKIADNSAWKIVKYYSKKGMDRMDMSDVSSIGMDEISVKKGHRYITVFANASDWYVLYVTEGKDSSVVKRFKDNLEKHGGDVKNIKEVSMDMSKSYQKGVNEQFNKQPGDNKPFGKNYNKHSNNNKQSNESYNKQFNKDDNRSNKNKKVKILFDHFHVTKILKKALDDTRKSEMSIYGQLLKKSKYLILKGPDNLKDSEKERLDMILDSRSKVKYTKLTRLMLTS